MNVRLGVHTPILILLVGGVVATLAANTASAGGETVAGPGQWVDPLIGTAGTGHTFPGASVPLGMVAPSPDNVEGGWAYASGYQ